MAKRKSKTESRVQALKDTIAAKSGTDEEHSNSLDENAAQFADLIEWNERYAFAQQDYINQLERLLDRHVPVGASV
jgi:hypothetical protein